MTNRPSSGKPATWVSSSKARILRIAAQVRSLWRGRPRVLFRDDSGNDPLIVVERRGIRYLMTGRRTQSAWKPENPAQIVHLYPRLMLAAFYGWPGHKKQDRPGRILILGLGAGILPRRLIAQYTRFETLTIEIDPRVYDAARRWFGLPDEVPVHIADGLTFLKTGSLRYEAIFLDVFASRYIPEAFLTEAFLRLCRSRLTEDGIVIANHYEYSPTRSRETAAWLRVFPDALEILNPERIRGNRILIGGPGIPRSSDELRRFAADESHRLGESPAEIIRLTRRIRPLSDPGHQSVGDSSA